MSSPQPFAVLAASRGFVSGRALLLGYTRKELRASAHAQVKCSRPNYMSAIGRDYNSLERKRRQRGNSSNPRQFQRLSTSVGAYRPRFHDEKGPWLDTVVSKRRSA